MNIRIFVVGHLKESYWREAEAEYVKRLKAYSNVEIIEFPDLKTPEKASINEENLIKSKEDAKIEAKLKPNDFVVLLDLNKEEPDSPSLSLKLEEWMRRGNATVNFVIGGSLGLSDEMKKRGNASFSLSRLTFTHQMSRVILLEQLYRAFKIAHHEPYHK